MSRKTLLGLAGVGLLALAACGQSEEEQFLEGMGCEDGETAEECGERIAAENMEAAPEPADEPELNSRMVGPVEASVGEAVEVDLGPLEEENNFAGTVTLESVSFTDTCGDGLESQAGQFATLTFLLDSDPDSDEELDFNGNTLSWPDHNDHLYSPESLDCQLMIGSDDPVGGGESGEYVMVLDLPDSTGELEWGDPTHPVVWSINGDEQSDGSEEPAEAPAAGGGASVEGVDFESCEESELTWGELKNAELDGVPVDEEFLAGVESWMQENGCW